MRPTRLFATAAAAAVLPLSLLPGSTTAAEQRPAPDKNPTAVGRGGAVTSVDPDATRVGLRVLRQGGNAVDAAVATAAALGVTEPYSAGLGGGGYLVHLDGRTGEVSTIDGRETAPAAMPRDAFIDPETGEPYPFTPELVTSGVSVGVPGTLATWETALEEWGTRSLRRSLTPAARLARRGFVVDQTFHDQTADNAERFAAFRSTKRLFLPGGEPPEVGSVFANPDLARLYELLGRKGTGPFYRGGLAARIAKTTRKPPVVADTDLPVPVGFMKPRDLRRYRTLQPEAVTADYRGLRVHGMGGSSSGGSTVGEALAILDTFDLAAMSDTEVLHHMLEASALAFADRAAYLGDRTFVDVPDEQLLSEEYAAQRACRIDPAKAATKPVPAGDVDDADGTCPAPDGGQARPAPDTENVETTHLTVADRWGDVVSYTLTIEQTGGSGIVVPGRGFLLNNELTDFSTVYDPDDPNRLEPGKRPRSSMSPTIITEADGTPVLALGSPGGSTIITTVLQLVVDHLDRGLALPAAVADPRGSQRNTAAVTAEPEFIDAYGAGLRALGHELKPAGDAFTSAAEIGAATGIGFGPGGLLTAVAEPERRGGGDARVLEPTS
ncbi:Gamma-glutamyltranspeptidase precursor [Nocardioides dokdonensis FR1436]|uniref:Glutathione hydrolase proenzyme n=1 Tax=Nocardioides dokdonensis FR1436 TaxID=1300347 RepID=A0A1A9GLJ0_9ACTN|nr:gamma-glutamyltransferase [Nocardioides dokdonensis]ANH38325.1 Gamma-glutamyltranspeptidase precursor [Nocardioides dokdonensis FR1436]